MDYLEVVRIHGVWRNMIARCENPENASYPGYGGRGITVCEAWHDFNVFAEWCLQNGSQKDLQLDRQNNDGPYAPDNCRFISRSENGRNKRNNRWIKAFGETKTLATWTEDPRCVVTDYTLRRRVDAGWDPEEAMTVKKRRDRQSVKCSNGHLMTEDNVYRRKKNGFRVCKTCAKARAREQYWARRSAA